MIKKILSLCLLIGLTLPTTKGSDMTEAPAEHPPKSGFSHLVERGNKTQASILEHNLLAYMGRYDKLTERSEQIDQILKLFLAHLRQAQQPCEGYEIILEDIRAHPDSGERARQLLQMEELIGLINSGNLTRETLTQVKANLDQRKQRDLSVRIGVIMKRIMESRTFKKMNIDLLDQIKTTFEKDLEKLRHYRNEEMTSKWTLESLLLTEPDTEAPAAETPLPILADVVRDYIELTQTIKAEELDYLQANIAILSGNRDQLTVILEEAKTLEETPERNEMIESLEKETAEILGFILRDTQRLEKLRAQA